MKKFALLLLAAMSLQVFAQEKAILDKPRTDNRVELLSIVFRLAGNQEYNNSYFKLYTDKIDSCFAPYKEHELIKFAQELRQERGVSYDAVMKMAVHLDNDLNPIVEFTDKIPEQRWGKDNAYKFVELLKKFYKDAACEKFFKENETIYAEASRRFLPVYEELDLSWYKTFYGKEADEKFIIINALTTGGGNYGVSVTSPDGKREVYAIMGAWSTDSTGMVVYGKDGYFPTLLHEFNHSFVNHLIDKNESALKENGEKIFEKVKDKMSSQAYGNWKTMMYEALVRAAVIKYMKDHDFDQVTIARETGQQLMRGFIWIRELVDELEKYDKNRSTYPTLESYMPNIVAAYQTYAGNMDKYAEQIENGKPKVVSIEGIINGDTNVDAATETIIINFDIPLIGKGYSINNGEKGKDAFPKFEHIDYANDNKSLVLKLKIESNKEYQFILTGLAFTSQEGIGMDSYEISFKTK
uniref:DUF4932 domain-containing protein n=1 Tax=uncultured bacterium contig00103(2014) TaxID=1465630 RepID=A0A060CW18_9BACT|nr:hypothetical protein [uncultured bacterium contig00103(2014)]